MLIKIQEGNMIKFEVVTNEQLETIVKDLHSISSCGMWENQNKTVIIVMESGVLNAPLIEFFLDNVTEQYLEQNYGFIPEELHQILENYKN